MEQRDYAAEGWGVEDCYEEDTGRVPHYECGVCFTEHSVSPLDGDYEYQIWANDHYMGAFPKRQAVPVFEYLKQHFAVEAHCIYIGNRYDPVLHYTRVYRAGIPPPCPPDHNQCPYRKSLGGGFNSKPRPTAFRTEIMDPSDRCGFKLKPNHIGGHDYDYGFCIPSGRNAR